MLPAANRMRRSCDFTSVFRGGSRVRSGSVVVHHLAAHQNAGVPLVGLVVGKNVGNSVVRHRVSRRLRAQLSARLGLLPDGTATVVRALDPAAGASSSDLAFDLDRALRRLVGSS